MRLALIIISVIVSLLCCEKEFFQQPDQVDPKFLSPPPQLELMWGARLLNVRWQDIKDDTVSLYLMYHQTPMMVVKENIPNTGSCEVLLPFMTEYGTGLHFSIAIFGEEHTIHSQPFSIIAWELPDLPPMMDLSIGTKYYYASLIGERVVGYYHTEVISDTMYMGKRYGVLQDTRGGVDYYRTDSTRLYQAWIGHPYWDGEEAVRFDKDWEEGYDPESRRYVYSEHSLDILGNLFPGKRIVTYSGYDSRLEQAFYPGLAPVLISGSSYPLHRLIAFEMDGIQYGDTTRYFDPY